MSMPISAAKGVLWPALPNPHNALLMALQYQLEQSQWMPWADLQQRQMLQLTALLAHAYQSVPFYKDRLQVLLEVKNRLLTYDDLRQIPILTRQDLQTQSPELLSTNLPKDHLPTAENRTSGSTGQPITFRTTKVKGIFYRALDLRSHLWHGHDFKGKVAAIKVPRHRWKKTDTQPTDRPAARWADVFPSGPMVEFDSGRPISEQLQWLQQEQPNHILTYPSNLAALAKQAKEKGVDLPALKHLSTFGEVLTPEIRTVCREVWNLAITDIYSCQEIGILALQCPEHEHYHIQSESVLVEVLNEHDQPCQPGQVGRVVITDLHNYAMPFIRYEIGDYAEVGESCTCGRTLPVLKQVLGRTRNMLVLPSGEQLWPSFVLSNWAKIGPIRQMQVVQHSQTEIEVKLVLTQPMDEVTEQQLRDAIAADLDPEFQIRLTYVDEIPRAATGKYEDFVSKVRL